MEVPLTPLDLMRRARKLYGQREAVVDGDRRFSYAEFFDRCDRWSKALQAFGLRRGDRVAYVSTNLAAHLEAYVAVPQLGAVLVPINPRLSTDDFSYVLRHCRPRVVCADAGRLEQLESLRAKLLHVERFVALEGGRHGWLRYEEVLEESDPYFEPPRTLSERDLLSINYTSGSAGQPRGVMLTHRNACLNVLGTLLHLPMHAADRYLWTMPMSHANGWGFPWAVAARGATQVCLRSPEPAAVFDLVERESITMLCAEPGVLASLADAAVGLRKGSAGRVRVVTGGAPPAAATIERVESSLGWEVTHVYGLTEAASFVSLCEPRPEDSARTPAQRYAIKARQGVESLVCGDLRVLDALGRDVPHDGLSEGEIHLRGNTVMFGYYDDPVATATALAGGWLRSGDVAVIHPDGYLEIRDRIKDVIISGGESISALEVEAVLSRHPAVREVAVVGMPDPRWGESPHAFVVCRTDAAPTSDDLIAYARERLAHFKAPRAVVFVSSLPKTATGLVQKSALRGHAAINRR